LKLSKTVQKCDPVILAEIHITGVNVTVNIVVVNVIINDVVNDVGVYVFIILLLFLLLGFIQPRAVHPLLNIKGVYLLPYLLPCFCFS
jgi:hypothetical protein